MSNSSQTKVLMAGVVPPPIHGQSLATKALFEANLAPIRKILIPINSSQSLDKVGKLSLTKISGLLVIILKTWVSWIRERPPILYYTAGSGAWVPFFRDVLFLGLCRPLFKRTLIHFHSGDLNDFLQKSSFRTWLGRQIYGRGAWTLRLGPNCPAPIYPTNRVLEIPNGIASPLSPSKKIASPNLRILFLGNLFESKGVIDLLQGVRLFAENEHRNILLSLVGGWADSSSRQRIEMHIANLPANVNCPSPRPMHGEEKWNALANHDVLVFPSYYERENLPLVVIEAMAASLPTIASNWRGIPSLIEDGENGLLVPTSNPSAIATALHQFFAEPDLAASMGKRARKKFEEQFTLDHFLANMKQILQAASADIHAHSESTQQP